MPNPHPAGFLDLLAQTDGRVLDCGAGGRKRYGVTALEYVAHPNNDVQGSALDLPFRSDTFDLVLSQAVLEHVTNPQRAVDEMVRVLAPGGRLFMQVAFLQPVHMAPHHYLPATPFGALWLCRALEVEHVGVVGSWATTMAWLGDEMGWREHLSAAERAAVLAVMAKLDAAMTPAQRWNTAPGVELVGVKRWPSPSSSPTAPDASGGNGLDGG